jgi:hypothetical protein
MCFKSWPTIWVAFGCLAWTGLAQVNPNNVGGPRSVGAPAAPPAPESAGGAARGGASPARPSPARSAATNPIHVYSKKAGAWTELQSDFVSLESGSTPGIVKGNVDGAHSETRLVAPSELSVRVPDGVKAAEFQLLRLHAQNGQRTFRAVTREGFRTEVSSGDAVKFKAKDVAPNTYLLSFPPLSAGEYGLLAPLARDASRSPAKSGRLYAFRVVKE